MNNLLLCCCDCTCITEFFNLLGKITIPICIVIAIAVVAKSPVWQQWIRSRYDLKIKEAESQAKISQTPQEK